MACPTGTVPAGAAAGSYSTTRDACPPEVAVSPLVRPRTEPSIKTNAAQTLSYRAESPAMKNRFETADPSGPHSPTTTASRGDRRGVLDVGGISAMVGLSPLSRRVRPQHIEPSRCRIGSRPRETTAARTEAFACTPLGERPWKRNGYHPVAGGNDGPSEPAVNMHLPFGDDPRGHRCPGGRSRCGTRRTGAGSEYCPRVPAATVACRQCSFFKSGRAERDGKAADPAPPPQTG